MAYRSIGHTLVHTAHSIPLELLPLSRELYNYISFSIVDGQPVLHPLENLSFYVFLNTEIKRGIKSEIQKFKAKIHNIYYMSDVYSTLHELERSSLNQWTCVNGESKEHKDDSFIYLSRAVVFTIDCRDYKM